MFPHNLMSGLSQVRVYFYNSRPIKNVLFDEGAFLFRFLNYQK